MDKTLLNVAGILSIVFGIIACITIIGVIVGVPMIIGGSKFREISKLEDAQIFAKKDTILVWSIVFLFLNVISGVLGLIFYISLENSISNNINKEDSYDKLEKIKKLYDDKVLTKQEYEEEKAKILNR